MPKPLERADMRSTSLSTSSTLERQLLSRKVDPVPPAACRGQGSTAQGGQIAGRVSRDLYPVASKVAGSVVETLAPSMVCL